MLSAITVAEELMSLTNSEGKAIKPMKIVALTYISHARHLGTYDVPLISDSVVAADSGPFIQSAYYYATGLYNCNSRSVLNCQNFCKFFRNIYGMYRNTPDSLLLNSLCGSGTPWQIIYHSDEPGLIIPTDLIKTHFPKRAKAKPLGSAAA